MIPPGHHDDDTGSRVGDGDPGGLTDLIRVAPDAAVVVDASLEGEVVGDVRIGSEIGQGGMGCVYAGTQDKPHRTVAVKVMQSRFASPDRLKRFELEAETLGRLQHRGVAGIYAFGVHGEGKRSQPYFVMEYIRGAKTITQYVKDRGFSIRKRLELFSDVCEAVAYVQQNGVIHRDLKPGNILVDEDGQPKVIDFGIARDTSVADNLTQAGEVMGTRAYMSPEHYRLGSRDVDVRADVYSLGVVLYELVSGRLPFDLDAIPEYAAGDIVSRQDPTPLTAEGDGVDVDIQAIVGKCLSKEPDRRYAGASELAADISRYLEGLPIEARSQSAWEWFWRLCLRHGAATAAVAAMLVTLLASLGLVTRSYRREFAFRTAANDLTNSLERELETSQRLRQDSDQIVSFLTRALQLPAPQSDGATPRLDELLRNAAAAAQRHRFALEPGRDADLRARMLLTIGTTLVNVGRPQDAVDVLGEADRAVATIDEGRSHGRALVLNELGLASMQSGRYEAAREAIERAIDIALLHRPPSDLSIAMLRHNVALASARLGELDRAAKDLEDVHGALVSELDGNHPRVGVVLRTQGDVMRRQGRLAEAEAHARAAMKILESAGPESDVDLALAIDHLGEVCRLRGRTDEAIALLERARAIQITRHGRDHPFTATTLGRLGAARHAAGDLAAARDLCRQAIAIRDRCGTPDHPEKALVLRGLARIEEDAGNRGEAAEHLGLALAIQRAALPAGHPDTVETERELQEFNRRGGSVSSGPATGESAS